MYEQKLFKTVYSRYTYNYYVGSHGYNNIPFH